VRLTGISAPSGLERTSLLLSLSLPLLPHKSNIIIRLIHVGKVASASGHACRILTTQPTARPSRCLWNSPGFFLYGRRNDRNSSRSSSSRLLCGRAVEGLHRCPADGEVGVARRGSSVVWSRVMPHYLSAGFQPRSGVTSLLADPRPVGSQVSITSACRLPFLSSAAFFWPALSSLVSFFSPRPHESEESDRRGRVLPTGEGGRLLCL
jgi:hypothetical protein